MLRTEGVISVKNFIFIERVEISFIKAFHFLWKFLFL